MKTKYNKTFGPSDTDFDMNACVGYDPNSWGTNASGFQLSANKLVDFARTSESDIDILIYPIAFLFRHTIELLLKKATQTTGTSRVIEKGHNLLDRWDAIAPQAEERFKGNPSYIDFKGLREVIKDFENVDSGSFDFRYPFTTSGNRTLDGVTNVNINVLAQRANNAIEQLTLIIDAYP
ncbi:hypothetical protein VN12_06275 [Pirellula sp. SH-Sr6A]|uniref:hypothetical protein n=1 Tax=Pirellula sp. SH-Sr6A TaxID=1632865 RepID=UPI00078B4431|nr:hypothetical protein [Pirellula sp. SH-Sr6A]AMV31708.1 hypothetical protein VN12_06275 [Pirellula sp. SH-Sr6A]